MLDDKVMVNGLSRPFEAMAKAKSHKVNTTPPITPPIAF
jgi:hypothetical protein